MKKEVSDNIKKLDEKDIENAIKSLEEKPDDQGGNANNFAVIGEKEYPVRTLIARAYGTRFKTEDLAGEDRDTALLREKLIGLGYTIINKTLIEKFKKEYNENCKDKVYDKENEDKCKVALKKWREYREKIENKGLTVDEYINNPDITHDYLEYFLGQPENEEFDDAFSSFIFGSSRCYEKKDLDNVKDNYNEKILPLLNKVVGCKNNNDINKIEEDDYYKGNIRKQILYSKLLVLESLSSEECNFWLVQWHDKNIKKLATMFGVKYDDSHRLSFNAEVMEKALGVLDIPFDNISLEEKIKVSFEVSRALWPFCKDNKKKIKTFIVPSEKELDGDKVYLESFEDVNVNDIVCVYSSGKERIMYICTVKQTEVEFNVDEDNIIKATTSGDNTDGNKYIELTIEHELIEDKDNYPEMDYSGFKKKYLERFDKGEENEKKKIGLWDTNNQFEANDKLSKYLRIMKALKDYEKESLDTIGVDNEGKEIRDMNPYNHDGCYCVLRTVLNCYYNLLSVKNKIEITDYDINFIYYIVRIKNYDETKIEKLKKTKIYDQNLFSEDRFRKCLECVKNRNFGNKEHEEEKSIGIVGSGGEFIRKDREGNSVDNAHVFVHKIAYINETEDDDDNIYQYCKELPTLNGIDKGILSVIMHCIKPFVFPILNGPGVKVYEALGIVLHNDSEKTYVKNYVGDCIDIKNFRNENFRFKNYRIIDLIGNDVIKELESQKTNENGNKVDGEAAGLYKNIVFYGPPGTGKTRKAKIAATEIVLGMKGVTGYSEAEAIEYAEKIINGNSNEINLEGKKLNNTTIKKDKKTKEIEKILESCKDSISLVQFHPSYSYNDFMETIDISKLNNKKKTKKKRGEKETNEKNGYDDRIFKKIVKKAKDDPNNNYVIIIDEINRANVSEVLGELLYAIEYRGKEITTSISNTTFSVPHNLYIIGTMNTADRSLQTLDYAVRRRFDFIEVPSEKPMPFVDTDKKKLENAEIEDDEPPCYKISDDSKYFFNAVFNRVKKDVEASCARGVNPEDIMPGVSYFIVNSGKNNTGKNNTEDNNTQENNTEDNNTLSYDVGHFEYKMKYELIPLLQEYVKDGMFTKRKDLDNGESLIELIQSVDENDINKYYNRLRALLDN